MQKTAELGRANAIIFWISTFSLTVQSFSVLNKNMELKYVYNILYALGFYIIRIDLMPTFKFENFIE